MMQGYRRSRDPRRGSILKRLVLSGLFIAWLSAVAAGLAIADEPEQAPSFAKASDPTSRNLLADLENFLRQRKVDVDSLTADQMVAVMIDWYRFVPAGTSGAEPSSDALVYRYGGWSEGCATGFRLSLLRRASDGGTDRVAGITLMFEPSSRSEIAPFTTASSDWKSMEAFREAVHGSPAFRQFGTAKPMAVMIERGGLR
jgi:hypothetical protein